MECQIYGCQEGQRWLNTVSRVGRRDLPKKPWRLDDVPPKWFLDTATAAGAITVVRCPEGVGPEGQEGVERETRRRMRGLVMKTHLGRTQGKLPFSL
jgi:hypothetical protein